ncbi:MAG: glutamate synthase (NADPH), homotetrameric [Spirochaetes bacterium GWD1_61_31]|nr:MAG: glutamate synthase (NADPH), homotetrameric [Spirochaetes bacterium GWB1_60_80]OHD29322.1 MAG: glutamate synthase (NADPH), homotetrameric [Spirochaetes bacterium GWC1_61_12]OHD35830.1 MAG: glutamate synthase (NADPH), homotetrameric [Spirochaetes bacterium GWD1_61_31]OHD46771.1 MAG: glutamate synthase (NADPH), homotetrameric [Spirochaetes bacterium GWE1_60_18]OHD61223.1 MAG: glutamate synthase (NADPH), homotetrameric [Spirochaetes bacterium GWF1_60_12]HAP43019.1 glutamate synthase (NADPH
MLSNAEILRDPSSLGPRERMAIAVQDMPCQEPAIRATNMEEVALGYSEEQARLEAARCLQCKTAPCIAGCPVGIDIPGFLAETVVGRYAEAAAIIRLTNLLPAICGRVCPQEVQCQAPCTLGKALKSVDKAVQIGRLERFVADREREAIAGGAVVAAVSLAPATGKRVAVVGSGPAGLTVAADVRRAGHEVVIFEAFQKVGGVMVYGIPEFRLPKAIVREEAAKLEAMGVRFELNTLVGRTRPLQALLDEEGFDAVFVGVGAGLPKFMNIPGEILVGVFSANEYLTRANLMKAWDRQKAATPLYPSQRVAVLGGGNVAMDAARMALRLGAAEVHVLYRRTRAEMPARAEEVGHAMEEGIQFQFLTNPVEIYGNGEGRVAGVVAQAYQLGEPDESGRRRPVAIPGSERKQDFDTVIVALGNESNPLLAKTTPGLKVDKWSHILVDGEQRTSMDRIWAGGDIVLGAATVILAMGEGRRAAVSINRFLAG